MENDLFLELIKEYLKDNLTIDARKAGGEYGSNKYVEITLKLNNETISTCHIDE